MIQPALAPKLWAEVIASPWPHDSCIGDTPETCAYLVALNNHALPEDDERKITRQDAQEISDAAFAIGRFGGNVPWQRRLEALANRLRALLPPDQEEG